MNGDNLEHHYVILNRLKSYDTSIFPLTYITDLYNEHDIILGTDQVFTHLKNLTSEIQERFKTFPSKEELRNQLLIYAHTINEKVKEDGFPNTVSDQQLAVKLLCAMSESELGNDLPWYGTEVTKDG